MDILLKARGFTLIELMITLAIAAILVTTSTGFGNIIQRNELTTVLNTLITDMNFARSEAIKTGTEVVICISQDGINCAKGDSWHNGWMVYYDSNGDRRKDSDEPLTRQQNALGGTITIVYNGRPVDNYVRFRSDGTTHYNGTFALCNTRDTELKRALVLSNTGRLRSASYLPNGKAVNCSN
ncbi:MAG: hypothetical protein COC09_02220 [Gammaproteobacteria bacterium]|nr:GspH/FimT family pseudopilin [Gammaproteobacteria bacterium]PCH64427.1 MAG: hypothetical protein COC09_02220 [Gammaproteobacteria bacterium]